MTRTIQLTSPNEPPTLSVQGNRITDTRGYWWELQEDPRTAPLVGSVNDGPGKRRAVKAIAGRRDEEGREWTRILTFHMTEDVYLAWLMANTNGA